MPTSSLYLSRLLLLFLGVCFIGTGALLETDSLLAADVTYVCDSGTDAVYRMEDTNQDGTIDPATEVQVFYDDSSPGPDLSTPLHLLGFGNSILVADAGTIDAILRLTDLNGDGDANDAGEVSVLYDDSSSGPSVPHRCLLGGSFTSRAPGALGKSLRSAPS